MTSSDVQLRDGERMFKIQVLYPNCVFFFLHTFNKRFCMVSNKVDTHFPYTRHQRIHIIVVTDPIECEVHHVCLIRRQKDHVRAVVYG